jgi:membrane associated rhomboid family serine protease
LTRSTTALAPVGATVLLGWDRPAIDPAGLEGWDLILLANNPGQAVIYAFTALNADPSDFQAKVDAVTRRFAAMDFFGGQPVSVVYVGVAAQPLDVRQRRHMLRAVPRAFYAGLQPVTWLADLSQRRLDRKGGRGVPGSREVTAALDTTGPQLDPEHAEALRRAQFERSQAFVELMRGRQPIVTYALVLVNVVMYLIVQFNGGPDSPGTLVRFGALVPRLVQQGQWWRLFTVMFLHASIPHILFNMMSLVVVGMLTERLYGSSRFLAIYLGAGLIGALVSYEHALLAGEAGMTAVGASGAIFGIVGALLTLRFQRSEVIPTYLRSRISVSMVPIVALNLFLGYTTPYIDNSAHLGGLVGGMLLSFVFPVSRRTVSSGARESLQ